ncbi:MAG: hypothetical protein DWQ42_07390 [Planctomycetota bacterium]|nr:MAG: hypothetical protein DWQ42_07390 [Planctomycetota bacterium]REK37881.1 MAG: hypothetical protein DWQ46_21720 [Planctomycetota bacterium]
MEIHAVNTTVPTWLRRLLPLVLLLLACGLYRATRASTDSDALADLAELPAAPHLVVPRYDLPVVATDEQLQEILTRMRPLSTKINTNVLVHALRMWGPHVEFADPRFLDGPTMLAYFLDDAAFRQLAGVQTPPLFEKTASGVAARAWQADSPHRDTAAVHVDDLLATLAESSVPLTHPMRLRDGDAQVADLLRGALARFHRRQHEYEWTAIAYARYLYPAAPWRNQYGEPLDVAQLVDELLEQPLPNGVCHGTHRLEALVVLAAIDEQVGGLSPWSRRKITRHLGAVAQQLVAAQHLDGYWTRSWVVGQPPSADDELSLYDRILLTGHHLEWLALAPPEVLPPRDVLARAGQWLARALLEADDATLEQHYGPFTHAARALCLWRGREPHQVFAWPQSTPAKGDVPSTTLTSSN